MTRKPHRFDVFGTVMSAERSAGGWRLFVHGADGKRRPADAAVPPSVAEEDLQQYLDDLFHESATPAKPCVKRL